MDMIDYVKSMIKNFPSGELTSVKVASPWNESIFKVKDTSLDLPSKKAK